MSCLFFYKVQWWLLFQAYLDPDHPPVCLWAALKRNIILTTLVYSCCCGSVFFQLLWIFDWQCLTLPYVSANKMTRKCFSFLFLEPLDRAHIPLCVYMCQYNTVKYQEDRLKVLVFTTHRRAEKQQGSNEWRCNLMEEKKEQKSDQSCKFHFNQDSTYLKDIDCFFFLFCFLLWFLPP